MAEDSSFDQLMTRLSAGDPDAARRIFEQYAHRLIALARSRMDGLIQQKESPEDVVQSALMSFFRHHAARPYELASWDKLWSLLTVITLRKMGHHIEYYRAACRDVRREAPGGADPEDSTAPWRAIAREPSPEEAVMLTDTLRELVRGLDEREQPVVSLALEGYGVAEISQRVGRSEYLVRKLLDRVRTRWEQLCD